LHAIITSVKDKLVGLEAVDYKVVIKWKRENPCKVSGCQRNGGVEKVIAKDEHTFIYVFMEQKHKCKCSLNDQHKLLHLTCTFKTLASFSSSNQHLHAIYILVELHFFFMGRKKIIVVSKCQPFLSF